MQEKTHRTSPEIDIVSSSTSRFRRTGLSSSLQQKTYNPFPCRILHSSSSADLWFASIVSSFDVLWYRVRDFLCRRLFVLRYVGHICQVDHLKIDFLCVVIIFKNNAIINCTWYRNRQYKWGNATSIHDYVYIVQPFLGKNELDSNWNFLVSHALDDLLDSNSCHSVITHSYTLDSHVFTSSLSHWYNRL